MIEAIRSPQNAHLKLVRRLQRRRARDQEGAFVVEGEDLVRSGLDAGATARVLLVDADRPPTDAAVAGAGCPVLPVDPKLLAAASSLGHPPRVVGIFELPRQVDLARAMNDRAAAGGSGPWLALDALGDPGNVGTILRSAAACGAGGVALFPDTADPWGPKAARASMGACFRVPIAQLDDAETVVADEIAAVRAAVPGMRVVALDADGDSRLWEAPIDSTTLLVVGGERAGVSRAVLDDADIVATIPQDPAVESVNAAVAASVALFEWSRRRDLEQA